MFGRSKEYYISEGNAQCEANQFEKALESYTKAIEMDRNDFSLFLTRGDVFSMLKEYNNAISDYSEAIKNPSFSEASKKNSIFSKAYFNRSNFYCNINKFKEAIDDISEYIRHNPDDTLGYNMKASYYCRAGDWDKAINEFSSSIKKSPNFDAYYFLGTINFDRQEYEKALSNFTLAYNLSPNNIRICDWMGETLCLLGRVKEAEKYLISAIKQESTAFTTYNYMGAICLDKKEFKNAISYLQKAISINDENPETHNALGWSYCKIGELEKGLSHIERAIKLGLKDSNTEKFLREAYSILTGKQPQKSIYDELLGYSDRYGAQMFPQSVLLSASSEQLEAMKLFAEIEQNKPQRHPYEHPRFSGYYDPLADNW